MNKLPLNEILLGDALKRLDDLPDKSIHCCVTSPPYYALRDYGVSGQIGLEASPTEYIETLTEIFRGVYRVLRDDGTLWINIGDSYAGGGNARGQKSPMSEKQSSNKGAIGQLSNHQKNINPASIGCKPKDLIGIPWMLAFALRNDGWYLRDDIIWHKPNPMPESVRDRCTKSYEHIFMLAKSKDYFFDFKSISEKSEWFEKDKRSSNGPTQSKKSENSEYQCNKQGVYNSDGLRNKRNVWTVKPASFSGAHFATFPEQLIVDCIKAGCPENGVVLDPFMGAGTTGLVARKLNVNYIGIELNPKYKQMAEKRILQELGFFA